MTPHPDPVGLARAPTSPAPRRLLLVTDEVTCGGAEIAFFTLAEALAGRIELHLALGAAASAHPAIRHWLERLRRASTQVQRAGVPLFAGTAANLHPALRRRAGAAVAEVVRRVAPDLALVNLSTVERGQAVVDGVRAAAPGAPVWGYLHLPHPPGVLGARLGRLRDPLVPSLLRRFDRLLTVSRSGARALAERFGVKEPFLLYPPTASLSPLPSPELRRARRAAEGLPSGFLLGVVGRVCWRHKGQDAALRVIRRLLDRGRDVQLAVIGDGPDLTALRQLAGRLALTERIHLLGWRNDVGALVPLLDALLMPSRFEGLPQAAVQAATAHVPVLAYAVDGLGELLPPGFGVPPGDEAALAAAVTGWLDGSRVWPAAAVAARARAWCDPAAAAERFLALVRSLAGPGVRSGGEAPRPY